MRKRRGGGQNVDHRLVPMTINNYENENEEYVPTGDFARDASHHLHVNRDDEVLEQEEGIKVDGYLVQSVGFVDDQLVSASAKDELLTILTRLKRVTESCDMRINIKTIKVMKIGKSKSEKMNWNKSTSSRT